MHCNNCGAPLESDAKFCTNCGTPVEVAEEVAQNTPATEHTSSATADSVKKTVANIQENEYIEKGKVYALNYWGFYKKAIKAPFRTASHMQQKDVQTHGLTTLILYALFLPLLMFFMMQTFNSYVSIPFFDVVIKPFLILAAVSALMAAVLFGVGKLMRADVSYRAVLGAYGTLHILPVSLLLLSMILLIFNNYGLISIIVGLTILVLTTINVSTLFAIKDQLTNKVGLDVVYAIIVSYLALIIIALIVSDSVMGSMLSDFEYMMNSLF